MIIRNHTPNDATLKADGFRQPSCIYKIVADASRAQKCELREFECKGTQFFVNPRYVLRTYS